MDFLHTENLTISIALKGSQKELGIKIKNTNKLYKCILREKLDVHGYKKYRFDDQLIKYIYESKIINVQFNEFDDSMILYIHDIEFDDGKKYKKLINVKMNRFFDIDSDVDIDEIQNIEVLKIKLKESLDYIKLLENKISNLKQELDEKNKVDEGYYSDWA